MMEYDALQKLDELLNKIPFPQMTRTQLVTTRRVTFDPTTRPAAIETPTPRVQEIMPPPRVQDTPTPTVQEIMPPPRVQNVTPPLRIQSTPQTITAANIDKPLRQIANKTVKRILNSSQTKLRDKISDARQLRSRLSMRTHMQRRPHGQQRLQGERIQLVRDDKTGEYLNY